MNDPFSRERIQAAYDVAADDYQSAFGDDLARLPLDREMLDQARRAAGDGCILDLGCGTGSAGSYIDQRGARVVGIDLSLGMLTTGRRARLRYPVTQGDMRHSPFHGGVFAAAVAYYSLHHVPRTEVDSVVVELARVLAPGGTVLVGTHLGEGEVRSDKFLGHDIATTGGTLYSPEEIVGLMSSNGFTIGATELRDPLPHEHQTRRIYVLATRLERARA